VNAEPATVVPCPHGPRSAQPAGAGPRGDNSTLRRRSHLVRVRGGDLVVEVVSPESAHRDRTVKLRKYAEAGIRHYWCVEDEDSAPVVHVYELDEPTKLYAPAGVFRGSLSRPVPFEITLDLGKLTPPRRT
jgi:hypothetical protein